MQIEDIQKGHNVEIEASNGSMKMNFQTEVVNIIQDAVLVMPIMKEEKPVGFPENLMVSFYYAEGGKLQVWKDIRIKPVKYENNIYHLCKLSGTSESVNRRGAFRVYVGEEMDLTYFTSEGPKSFKALIKDISETGFAFVSEEEFDLTRVVRCSIALGKGKYIPITASIVRKVELENESTLYGCRFNDKNQYLSTWLMKYQQEKQRGRLTGAVSKPGAEEIVYRNSKVGASRAKR
ncbi:MAG: PilZ domain-containing protein [Lachnospiraceae bacterium]|nr:PilZ domain-containing protein [Lachnospiraceae bacterium]